MQRKKEKSEKLKDKITDKNFELKTKKSETPNFLESIQQIKNHYLQVK